MDLLLVMALTLVVLLVAVRGWWGKRGPGAVQLALGTFLLAYGLVATILQLRYDRVEPRLRKELVAVVARQWDEERSAAADAVSQCGDNVKVALKTVTDQIHDATQARPDERDAVLASIELSSSMLAVSIAGCEAAQGALALVDSQRSADLTAIANDVMDETGRSTPEWKALHEQLDSKRPFPAESPVVVGLALNLSASGVFLLADTLSKWSRPRRSGRGQGAPWPPPDPRREASGPSSEPDQPDPAEPDLHSPVS